MLHEVQKNLKNLQKSPLPAVFREFFIISRTCFLGKLYLFTTAYDKQIFSTRQPKLGEGQTMKEFSEAIKNGSFQVFSAFYKAEFDNVAHFIGKYVRDSFQAEDLAQESFISLWNTRERIDTSKNIRTYIFTIARNKALNFLRDTAKERGLTIVGREAEINAKALESACVSEYIEALEQEKIIANVYRTLPNDLRLVFRLSREEGLSYKEIASKMNITVKSVEYRMSKVLNRMKKVFMFLF